MFAAILAAVPIATSADTKDSLSFPRSSIPHLYVRERTSIDISLPEHEGLTSNPVTADGRWNIATASSGDVVHIVLKPSLGATDQLLSIFGSKHAMHILVAAGPKESTAYTVSFYEPRPVPIFRPSAVSYHPAPSVTPAPLRPKPEPTPRVLAIQSCNGLDSNYSWHGDARIDLQSACEDRKHEHTFLIMREGRNPPGVVPYRIDVGGKQDQIRNATFVPAVGSFPQQWVIDGVADKWALVADSSSGQIRTTITHADGK